MTRRQRRAQFLAILIGFATTLLVIAAYWAHALDRLENITLDLRFRNPLVNSIESSSSPALVVIAIDDGSLKLVGRWPWPRDVQAAVLQIAREAGARAVLVDLTYAEPEPLRTIPPADLDLVGDPLSIQPGAVQVAYPDYALRSAIRDAGQIYLAFHYEYDVRRSAAFERAVDARLAGDDAALQTVIDRIEANDEWRKFRAANAPYLTARELVELVARLYADPEHGEAAFAAGAAAADPEFALRLQRALPGCLEAALRRHIRAQFSDAQLAELEVADGRTRDAALAALYARITGQPRPARATRVASYLDAVLRDVLSLAATGRERLLAGPLPSSAAPQIDSLTPVYFMHAGAATRCGFVNFSPDRDGVVRHERVLVQSGGQVYVQLALAVACDVLDMTSDDITIEPHRIILRTPQRREPLVIQLDDEGYTVLPWMPASAYSDGAVRSLAVDDLWSVYQDRTEREQNLLYADAVLAALLQQPAFATFPQRQELLDALEINAAYRDELLKARYRLQSQIAADCAREVAASRETLRGALPALQRWLPESGAAPPAEIAQLEDIAATVARYDAAIDGRLARLRQVLDGSIALVGYTATSLADMKPIPTHNSAPGVYAHLNMLNGLLTGRTVHWAPPWANMALAGVLGLFATAVSVTRKPREGLIAVAALVVAFVAIAGWYLFYQFTYWVALTPSVLAMGLSYLAIAVFTYIFVERERRQLSTALGQYTSASIARQMAENPELCQRAEMRAVTTMFTDLRGFTTIAERIGAERTQRTLNVCLGRFTETMLRHEAMVNKFIGDGIFAFWNPVIYEQPDHAHRACATALDLLVALEQLKRDPVATGGDEIFGELMLRVGVATGNAIVGPCGSEQKYDYTCIGDSVNVAARLESANKFYGTRILVSEGTRDAVGENFVFRSLGGVKVKGKANAVQIYELLGRPGAVPEDLLRYAGRFGDAITSFQQREFAQAGEQFVQLLSSRPDDTAARAYAEACRAFVEHGPDEAWSGALELTEK